MLADQVAKDRGQPATVRIGTVVQVSPLRVLVQATLYESVGVAGGYIPAVGDVVALLGQSAVSADGSSWLAVCRIVPSSSAMVSAATQASGVDTNTVVTASAAYVPLTGLFNPSLVFVGPHTGRIIVHWRASFFADAGTVGRCSFQIREGGTVGVGTVVWAASDTYSMSTFSNVSSPEFGTTTMVTLTPGVVYNIELQHRRQSGAGNTLYANRQVMVQPAP